MKFRTHSCLSSPPTVYTYSEIIYFPPPVASHLHNKMASRLHFTMQSAAAVVKSITLYQAMEQLSLPVNP